MFDLQYFGNIIYYSTLLKSKTILFSPKIRFQKGWFNNKCSIVSSTGLLKLSVPLSKGRNQKNSLSQIKIAYEQDWRKQHLKAIKTCYSNSPFFDYYFQNFESLFSKKYENLFDLNFAIIEMTFKILKMDNEIKISENEELLNFPFCSKVDNMFHEQLENNVIKYSQVFENKLGFILNASVIDIIFNLGPLAKEKLSSN